MADENIVTGGEDNQCRSIIEVESENAYRKFDDTGTGKGGEEGMVGGYSFLDRSW